MYHVEIELLCGPVWNPLVEIVCDLVYLHRRYINPALGRSPGEDSRGAHKILFFIFLALVPHFKYLHFFI